MPGLGRIACRFRQQCRQTVNRRVLIEFAQLYARPEFVVDALYHAHCKQRVAAKVEERFTDTENRGIEQRVPYGSEPLLDVRGRWHRLGLQCVARWLRKCETIDLTAWSVWQLCKRDDNRRNELRWKLCFQCMFQLGQRRGKIRRDVGNELGLPKSIPP